MGGVASVSEKIESAVADIESARESLRCMEMAHGAYSSDAHIALSRLNVAHYELSKCLEGMPAREQATLF